MLVDGPDIALGAGSNAFPAVSGARYLSKSVELLMGS
jgi:hypothetical protein